jgi:hypothetical protein
MRFKIFLFILVFLLTSTIAMAQNQVPQEKENIFIVVKDIQGEKLEG